MATTRKSTGRVGRPPKAAPAASPQTEAAGSDSERIARLEALLASSVKELQLYRSLGTFTDKPSVTIRHSGNGPQLVFKVDDKQSVVLNPKAPENVALIPLDVYHFHKNHTNWFSEGYVYAEEDEDNNNPNLILDPKEWLESRSEDEVEEDISLVTGSAALMALYNYTSEEPTTGKKTLLRKLVVRRAKDVLDIELIEDPGIENSGYALRR